MTPTEKKEQMKLLHEIGSLPAIEKTELLMTIRNKCRDYKLAHGSPPKKNDAHQRIQKKNCVGEGRRK